MRDHRIGLVNPFVRENLVRTDPKIHNKRFWTDCLSIWKAGSLLIFDKRHLAIFAQSTQANVEFIARGKTNLVYTLERTLIRTVAMHDYLVWIGDTKTHQPFRLIEILHCGK